VNIPFTTAEFYGVFSAYNTAVWALQLPLMALGVLAIVLLVRQRSNSSRGISAILTLLWVWQAFGLPLGFFHGDQSAGVWFHSLVHGRCDGVLLARRSL